MAAMRCPLRGMVATTLLMLTSLPAPASPTFTCADMNSTDTTTMSYQGAWTYRRLDPKAKPFDTGAVSMAGFSDYGWRPDLPMIRNPMGLTVVPATPVAPAIEAEVEAKPPCASLKGPFCSCPGNCR